MANVLNRTTLEYRRSVNTPDHADPPWLVVPTGSANQVFIDSGVPRIYWKLTGDVLSEMSQGEKDTVDAAILAAARTASWMEASAAFDANEPLGHQARAVVEWFAGQRNVHITRMEEIHAAFAAMKASTGGAQNTRDAIPASFAGMVAKNKVTVVGEIQADLAAGNQDV